MDIGENLQVNIGISFFLCVKKRIMNLSLLIGLNWTFGQILILLITIKMIREKNLVYCRSRP